MRLFGANSDFNQTFNVGIEHRETKKIETETEGTNLGIDAKNLELKQL